MSWNCLAKNPSCDYGWIAKNGMEQLTPCECQKIERAKRFFIYGGFNERMDKPFDELEDTKIKNCETEKTYKYRELGKLWSKNINKLIAGRGKAFLVGYPGLGKTQFAHSLAREYLMEKGTEALFLETMDIKRNLFNNEKREQIMEWVEDPNTKLLVIDDLALEVSKTDERLIELIEFYNKLIRKFDAHEGFLLVTTNKDKSQLIEIYPNKRLTSILYQGKNTQFFQITSEENFRNNSTSNNAFAFMD